MGVYKDWVLCLEKCVGVKNQKPMYPWRRKFEVDASKSKVTVSPEM